MRHYMRHCTLLCAAALLSGASLVRAGTWADLSIVDHDRHRPLETYRYQGKAYVAGRTGDYYAVRITNRTGERLLVVLSVDGVNAITGQTASPEQTGYVLRPWTTAEIAGWRKATDEVAGFYFTRLSSSYADRTGRPANVGVIGAAVFREARPPQPEIAAAPRDEVHPAPPGGSYSGLLSRQEAHVGSLRDGGLLGAAPAKSGAGAPEAGIAPRRDERIGTGHGEREYSLVHYTSFRRASSEPVEVLSVFYDSYDNLVAQGIIPSRRQSEPDPFPGGFAPDPPR
jgi:hypothetical protein